MKPYHARFRIHATQRCKQTPISNLGHAISVKLGFPQAECWTGPVFFRHPIGENGSQNSDSLDDWILRPELRNLGL
ncbi:hypothetical protein MPTK1_8g00580 [Marchantia polymorpha subsp. ruderalis]